MWRRCCCHISSVPTSYQNVPCISRTPVLSGLSLSRLHIGKHGLWSVCTNASAPLSAVPLPVPPPLSGRPADHPAAARRAADRGRRRRATAGPGWGGPAPPPNSRRHRPRAQPRHHRRPRRLRSRGGDRDNAVCHLMGRCRPAWGLFFCAVPSCSNSVEDGILGEDAFGPMATGIKRRQETRVRI